MPRLLLHPRPRTSGHWISGALAAALVACGARPTPPVTATAVPARDRIAIVVAEAGLSGVHLVAVDEHGDRQFNVLAPGEPGTRDMFPAISPDCRWLAFASSRGRAPGETSLWIAPLGVEAAPIRLTSTARVDTQPAWTPDGKAIVFASRDGTNFDLYRLAIANGHAHGEPERLTSAEGLEVMPAVAPDGTVLFAAMSAGEGGRVTSRIGKLPDAQVTDGPGDTAPGVSPDGRMFVFSRSGRREDVELWMAREGASPAILIELPLTDEGGPAWSRDGRFLFATSKLVGEGGAVKNSAVIVIDLAERPVRARMLEDRAGATDRLHPAIACEQLDARALDADPLYGPELMRIIEGKAVRQAAPPPQSSPPTP